MMSYDERCPVCNRLKPEGAECLHGALGSAPPSSSLGAGPGVTAPQEAEEKCDKCGRMFPRRLVAIEVKDGAPIDDPAGFQWCIVCHGIRVDEQRIARIVQLEASLSDQDEALTAKDETIARLHDKCATLERLRAEDAHNHIQDQLLTAEKLRVKDEALTALKAAEQELSDSYLRIRRLVNAFTTAPGGTDRFAVTERKVADLVAQLQAQDEALQDALRQVETERTGTLAALEGIERLRSNIEAQDEAIATLRAALGYNEPWPVADVLRRLADAADHLLTVHSCDIHGWEGIGIARDRARQIAEKLAPLGQPAAAREALLPENYVGTVADYIRDLEAQLVAVRGESKRRAEVLDESRG